MSNIYFHHYLNSPFAEKVRRIFAYKNLAWHSVLQPPMMPKDDLTALTGGYRRIPVMQIGADVFCDTPLICDVLESLQPEPSLYPPGMEGVARTVAQWADGTVFTAAMAFNFGPTGAAAFFAAMPPEFAAAFIDDRKAMRMGAVRMHPADATSAYKVYLSRINDMLTQEFICGSQLSIADFSVYHSLWFTRNIAAIAPILENYPRILPWMKTVATLGADLHQRSSGSEAIAIAKTGSSPFFQDNVCINDHGITLGTPVSIGAESFGPETSTGTLIAATENRYSIERNDELAGTVRVHFPRVGFVLKALP